ncbi:MAG: TIR domain-containing protein [Flavobacteriales bacterium]
MKRRVFVGSSKEGFSIAEQVRAMVFAECEDWLSVETWKQEGLFHQNSSYLKDLITASRRFDYGILVASKDDKLISRHRWYSTPRDNVMFEMGLFLGSLGLTRAFLLVEEKAKLPTDYSGVTVAYFKRGNAESIRNAISNIVTAINKTKNTFNIKPVPSTALAMGYFSNFIQPLAKKRLNESVNFHLSVLLPRQVKDIRTEVDSYKALHPSREISIFEEGTRPRVYELENSQHVYWDIPTTLSTLGTMIDLLMPSEELGRTTDKADWIDHEMRNFAGTIEMLVKDCPACKGRVSIEYLS